MFAVGLFLQLRKIAAAADFLPHRPLSHSGGFLLQLQFRIESSWWPLALLILLARFHKRMIALVLSLGRGYQKRLPRKY
jgi:hypothetical protein